MAEVFYADNDIDYTVPLEDVNGTTAHHDPVTAGSVEAWIVAAASKEAAEAVDTTQPGAGIQGTCAHVGVDPVVDAEDKPLGTWLIHFDRSQLTRAVLDPLFPSGSTTAKPFLILDDPAGARVVLDLKYVQVRKATVTTA